VKPVRYPVADARDLAKWRRLVNAAVAAVGDPDITKELVKARNATWTNCCMPRGHAYPGSDFIRLGQVALRWTSVSFVQRQDMAPAFRALAERCGEHLDAIENARRRADTED
jgi:hypothetical protein